MKFGDAIEPDDKLRAQWHQAVEAAVSDLPKSLLERLDRDGNRDHLVSDLIPAGYTFSLTRGVLSDMKSYEARRDEANREACALEQAIRILANELICRRSIYEKDDGYIGAEHAPTLDSIQTAIEVLCEQKSKIEGSIQALNLWQSFLTQSNDPKLKQLVRIFVRDCAALSSKAVSELKVA